jgi:hypothetical protein
MAQVCDCNVSLNNTGRPGCVPIFNVVDSIILMRLTADDGTPNGIDLTQTLNEAYFNAFINNADSSKRWYPLPSMEEVDNPKAESITKEFSSGRKVLIRKGKRNFTGEIIGADATPEFNGRLDAVTCAEVGMLLVDVDGNAIGDYNGPGSTFLGPIPIDSDSWDNRYMFPTDSEPQKIMLEFDWARNYNEARLKMLTAAEAGQDFRKLEGLIDVFAQNLAASEATQAITFDATFLYGTAGNELKYKGADDTADWSIFNRTTLTSITLSGVTENPDGTYLLSCPLASFVAADELEISVTKDGFSALLTVVAGA